MRKLNKRFLIVLVIWGLIFVQSGVSTVVFAEMTETEKKALEAEKKAAELANEPQQQEQQEVVLTEAEKQALEAAQKATENQNKDQGQEQTNAQIGKLSGRISAIGPDSITVGIVGNNTVTVTGRTSIKFNGQISNLPRLHVADKVSVKYDLTTNNALSIEAEGFLFKATYEDVSTVACLGMIGHTPGLNFGMITTNGAGVKLDPGLTEVTINGIPATIADIQVGDNVDYVQNALDLKAFWVKITR